MLRETREPTGLSKSYCLQENGHAGTFGQYILQRIIYMPIVDCFKVSMLLGKHRWDLMSQGYQHGLIGQGDYTILGAVCVKNFLGYDGQRVDGHFGRRDCQQFLRSVRATEH